MLLSLTMPRKGEQMQSGLITEISIAEGDVLVRGSRLLDVRVDLGAVAPQDCPPRYCFRLVSSEKGWVRKLCAAVGEEKEVGEIVALITTEPDEPLDGPPGRSLRVSSAGILSRFEWPS